MTAKRSTRTHRTTAGAQPPITLDPAVSGALRRGEPVVALESAVVSHGLPHPTGIETAAELEKAVRAGGATPATVAVIAGRIIVGIPMGTLARLTRAGVVKVADRDLPVAVARSATGGTTVSATVAIADAVGIAVVSTGGIGGVHLGAEESWDISADLPALARHRIAVVCSGAKAICDIGKTLEYLDTFGVTVVAYRTGRFPNFYAVDSGYDAPQRIDSPDDAARILAAKRMLGQRTGLVIANPIPSQDAIPSDRVANAVQQALVRARAAGVRGADLTPHLLAGIADVTAGGALRANLSLLRANAALAAEVAVALARAEE